MNELAALKPRRKIPAAWRWVLILAGLVALVMLFYGEENWRGRSAWKRYKLQSAARGEPLDIASLTPPPVPGDQNFAMTPFLAPLFDFEAGTQKWRDTNALAQIQSFPSDFNSALSAVKTRKEPRSNTWVRAQMDLSAWYAALQKGANSASPTVVAASSIPVTTTQIAASILSNLSQYDPIVEELRSASLRPSSRFNLRYDNPDPSGILLPHLAVLKRISQLLQLRVSAELAVGQNNQAFEDEMMIFRLTDAIRDEPLLISHLVRIAELQIALQPLATGLANHQWSDAQLQEFERRLGGFDLCADARRTLEGERAFGNGIIDYLRLAPNRQLAVEALGGQNDQRSEFDPRALALAAVPSGWFSLEKLNYSRFFEDHILPIIDLKNRRIDPSACREANVHLNALIGHRGPAIVTHHRFFMALLLPAVSRAVQRTALAQTGVDAANVACALERYHLAHAEYPARLDALVPQFIAGLPHDRIDGQPLKYRRAEDGQYVLYSVGWNETDDGGAIIVNQSGDSIESEKGDWVWRLPAR